MNRTRRVAAIALLGAATLASAAFAQSAATPAGNFGGGALLVPIDERTIADDMVLAVRAQANGRAGFHGHIGAACALGTIRGSTQVAGDGSFELRGSVVRRPTSGVSETSRFTVRGTLTADGGEGTAQVRITLRQRGQTTRSCLSKSLRWTMRRGSSGPAAPAPAPAAATFYGFSEQRAQLAKRPLVLHVSESGRTIERMTIAYRAPCDRRRIIVADATNTSPEFAIGADGSFRYVERFRLDYSDVTARTTVVTSGQFDAAGAVAGRVSVTERYTSRRTGRRVDVCRTGTQRWSARR